MPRLGTRYIPIFFKPPQVTPEEIAKIASLYNSGIDMPDIIRRMQMARDERDGKCLSYVDIYTILFQELRAKRVVQRTEPLGEMPIKDFAEYIKRLREGGTAEECVAAISAEGRKQTTKSFLTRLFRTITDRHREYREKQAETLSGTEILQRESSLSHQLIAKFHRLSVKQPDSADGQKGKPRQAIILYLDELDKGFINTIYALGTDYSKDMAILLNNGMIPDVQAVAVAKPVDREALDAMHDEAAALLDRGVKQMPPEPPPPKPYEGPEDDEELSTLTAAELEEEAEAELVPFKETKPTPINFPSAHSEESRSPSTTSGFDLDNLGDEDEVAPEHQ